MQCFGIAAKDDEIEVEYRPNAETANLNKEERMMRLRLCGLTYSRVHSGMVCCSFQLGVNGSACPGWAVI